ncbi:MAG TPA: hypothetical protein VE669_09605, partial [Actinomycetota bacterium]|nr:hypothetical protein [Actinomycetota bacterium]
MALTFVATTAHTIGESGVGALLFDRVGTDALPVLYLAQGGVGLVGMLVLAGAFGRFDRRRGYVALPLLTAAIVLVERAVATADPAWIYPALWLTVTIAMLMQAVFLWGTAGLVTDTRRAKRLFPLFGAGGILGAVAGGFVTPPLARAIGAQNLLIVWGIGLLAAAALCASVLGVRRRTGHRGRVRARRVSPLTELARGSEFVRRSSLLRWMTGASVLFSVLYWSLYLPYAQAATARFPDPDDLAGFFGVFWASVTAVAFFASILLTNRLLGWFGAAVMIVALPLLYGGAFGTLLAASTFGAIVAV